MQVLLLWINMSCQMHECKFHASFGYLCLRSYLLCNIAWFNVSFQVIVHRWRWQWSLNTYCRQWVWQAGSSYCWWGSPPYSCRRHHLISQHGRWSGPSGHVTGADVSHWSRISRPSASYKWVWCHYRECSWVWRTQSALGRTRPPCEQKAWTLGLW